jgi:hypothetical protein
MKGKEIERKDNKSFNIHNIVEYYLLVGPQTFGYDRYIARKAYPDSQKKIL